MSLSLPVFLTILLVISILWTWTKLIKSNKSSSNPPPGPWKLPFIGNLHQLVHPLPHHRLRDLAKKFGPVMQLQVGEVSTVIISSSEAAKEVLKTHEINFVERPHLVAASVLFYNRKDIAFAPYGEYWRQVRKISILELLSAKRVRSFKSIREEEVSNFITSIYSKEGSPINLSRMIFSLGNGIIARASIGKKCKNQEAFLPIVDELMKALGGFNMIDIFPSSKFIYMVSRVRSRLERMRREADEILESIISERRANSALASKMDKNEEDDLLGVLLNLQDHGNLEFELTTSDIKAIILGMFSGGGDTSSTALEWAMSELVKNPRVMEKAQKEVRQVFNDIGTIPDEASLHDLKFLKLVIKETLRLHPSGPLIPRECGKRCNVNGYDIHVKSKVLINAWAIGRDPNYWNEPERFYPERFINVSTDFKGSDFEFIPFGAGKRMCPGMLFATANIEFLLAQMLYHFDWKPADGLKPENLDMTESLGGTVKRKRDLKLIPISYRSLVG
ncbi:cytochrome P450 726A27-like [Populus nigra]|uniref:cytochrome P450 726A27-like n=1 Tax=Populus nigra TaxID=3691 RepID=UPI002B279CCA|nr:cytochrome P450 726A27-like [Populus nigra]XP_061982796.1 cytochrome P450 726A27-like [Populus nigra]